MRERSVTSRGFLFLLLIVMAVSFAGGCSWAGRTAGKAQAKIERKADAVEKGYKEGYAQEKNKDGGDAQ